jgi:hypothetical protein
METMQSTLVLRRLVSARLVVHHHHHHQRQVLGPGAAPGQWLDSEDYDRDCDCDSFLTWIDIT